MNQTRVHRRTFLRAAAATTAAFHIVPRYVLGGPDHTPPSETINIALIGAGGQGFTNVKGLLRQNDVRFVAVADPIAETDYSKFYYRVPAGRRPVAAHIDQANEKRAGEAGAKAAAKCAQYVDFRKMLDKQGKDIDAVVVATPDHGHAVAAMAALQMGKHTFCEKPLAHSVAEARALRKAAREAKVATQMGNQGHCGPGFAAGVEWMRAESIGAVKEIFSWSGAGSSTMQTRPAEKVPVPNTIDDWDLWIGPAPYREYHPEYAPFRWRNWWDFGGGGLEDMGCHNIDIAFAAYHLDDPVKIEVETDWVSKETASTGSKIVYHCPAKGDRPAVKFTWCDGTRRIEARPPEWEAGRAFPGNGLLARCEKGSVLCGGWAGAPRLVPADAMKDFKRPEKTMPRVKGGHHRNWLDAVKSGQKALADFDYSARLTEFVLLGCLAARVGKDLEWDAKNMKVTNIPEANQFVTPQYRKGWSLG